MQIRARQIIREFIKDYPMSKRPLTRWESFVQEVIWKIPADVKQSFGSVSFVGRKTVFNIGGNKWRLLSHILYEEETVIVTHVLTHAQYDDMKIE